MNALALLKKDHATVKALFEQFEKIREDEGKLVNARKRSIVGKIIRELSIHAAIEEQHFYPAIRNAMKKKEDVGEVLEALEEHHVVKWLLSEIDGMNPTDERFDAKVTVLIESVRHHVKEEESEMFATVRKLLKPKELEALGAALQRAKAFAPTRPHPRAPDTPPTNVVASMGAMVADKARDALARITSTVKRGGKSNGPTQPRRSRAHAHASARHH